MQIRKANSKDSFIIRELTKAYTVSPPKSNGFVDFYIPSEKSYARRISRSNYCYIAEDFGVVAGFVLAYTASQINGNDPVTKHVHAQNKPVLYIEQLLVIQEYQRAGFGSSLLQKLINDAPTLKLLGVVAHKPRNKASINCVTKNGFRFDQELTLNSGIVLGAYKR